MTPWESLDSNPPYKAFLVSRGWTAARWNATQPWERTGERVEFNGGLVNDSLISQLPGAVADTVGGYKKSIVTAAAATGKTIARATVSTLVGLGITALIAYRKPILGAFKKVTQK